MRIGVILVIVLALAGGAAARAGTIFIDTLEDIPADGTSVISRSIGGITISIVAANQALRRRQRTVRHVLQFAGAGGVLNLARRIRGNVAGTRYLTATPRTGVPQSRR